VHKLDAAQVECLVFTYKEGLLSAVAHDLKIKATALTLDVSLTSIELKIDAASLRVVCARKDDRDSPGLLSDKDLGKIERNIREDVLDTARYPDIVFRTSKVEALADGYYRATGTLNLHGQSRPITTEIKRKGNDFACEVKLHQPDYGIKPYSAMFGTLKVQADLKITVSVSAKSLGL
jgi:polyisoprenoid-binding protein YceI